MVFYEFKCPGCGWNMERMVSLHVIEIKCPVCGNITQRKMKNPKQQNKPQRLVYSPTLQNPECFRVKASKGEVVVFYFEPLVTQDLKFSGFPKG